MKRLTAFAVALLAATASAARGRRPWTMFVPPGEAAGRLDGAVVMTPGAYLRPLRRKPGIARFAGMGASATPREGYADCPLAISATPRATLVDHGDDVSARRFLRARGARGRARAQPLNSF